MIRLLLIIFALGVGFACTNSEKQKERAFKLSYVAAGLGSNIGSKQSMFRIDGHKYLYTLEQTSFLEGQPKLDPDTVCSGNIRTTSIDSIIRIIERIKDTSIYETNPSIMSGGVHSIKIESTAKKLRFTLHNASHLKAEEILTVLNSNIPQKYPRLSLWGYTGKD